MNLIHSTAGAASDVVSGAPQQQGSFVLTPEEATRHRLHLVQYRKMLARSGERPRPHILIVEDMAFHRNLLYEVLHYTCSVATCTNATDGWQAYLKEVPDIAFLNIGLPGTDGHALANRIKLLDPLSYIVMVTASKDVYDVEVAKNNQVDGFIIKPYNKKKIEDCVNRYLAMRKALLKKTRIHL